MLDAYLVPYLTTYPFIIGLVALAIGAARRERMFRKNKVAQLQDELRQLGDKWFLVQEQPLALPKGVDLGGARTIVKIGTVGGKRGVEILAAHERDGTAGDFGSAGIFEADRRNRSTLKDRVPETLTDLVKYGDVHEKPKGFGNASPAEVEADVGAWGPEAQQFTDSLVQHHKARTKGKPGEGVLALSMGGHAYPGVFIAHELHDRLPRVPLFAVVNLPANEEQRKAFLLLKHRYEAAGVTGFLIGDQMKPRHVTQDSVIADLFAGFTSASIFSDLNTSFNNVATGIGNMVQFCYAFGEVVARPVQVTKNAPPQYIVYRDEVKSEARRLVTNIELGNCEVSVEGPIEPKPHQTYDLILLALGPDDVRRIRDDVEGAREIEDKQHKGTDRPHLHDKGNYHAVYTPWAQKVDPDHPRCQIAVIRLRALRNDPGDLEELVKFPDNRSAGKSAPVVSTTNGIVSINELADF